MPDQERNVGRFSASISSGDISSLSSGNSTVCISGSSFGYIPGG